MYVFGSKISCQVPISYKQFHIPEKSELVMGVFYNLDALWPHMQLTGKWSVSLKLRGMNKKGSISPCADAIKCTYIFRLISQTAIRQFELRRVYR